MKEEEEGGGGGEREKSKLKQIKSSSILKQYPNSSTGMCFNTPLVLT